MVVLQYRALISVGHYVSTAFIDLLIKNMYS